MRRSTTRRLGAMACVLAVIGLIALPGQEARGQYGDDRDLLRRSGGVPFVFVAMDTSASMSLDFFGNPLPANADYAGVGDPGDPDYEPPSRLYAAKKALYTVFRNATTFNYGFATYNQDALQVVAKHWLFEVTVAPGWELAYPAVGDRWVLGTLFRKRADAPENPGQSLNELGSCEAPISLVDGRDLLNRFAKLGTTGGVETRLWVNDGTDTFRVIVEEQPGILPAADGATITLDLDLWKNDGACSPPSGADGDPDATITLDLITDFLYTETGRFPGELASNSSGSGGGGGGTQGGLSAEEALEGTYQWLDAFEGVEPDCGDGRPFTGQGWDWNYDADDYEDFGAPGTPVAAPTEIDSTLLTDLDPAEDGYNLRAHPTRLRSEGRPVDYGDLLPYHWDLNNHAAFLRRLAPDGGTTVGPEQANFGIASYFGDAPAAGSDLLELRDPSQRPLVAAGRSPFAKMINDFRCWFQEKDTGQCSNRRFNESWQTVAKRSIGNEVGCAIPYLIVLSDGENTCGGEAPAADVAGMLSQAGVRTWVLALCDEDECATGQLNAIPNVGKGKLIYVTSTDQLEDELRRIRGIIEEESRTFASAAVPSVQATVADKIFVSNFLPLNEQPVWPGTVNAFLKPLPLDDSGRPDTDKSCPPPPVNPGDPPRSNCHLWNAGEVLETQIDASDPNGLELTQRRVVYARRFIDESGELVRAEPGKWGTSRNFLDPTPPPGTAPTDDSQSLASAVEKDLWTGMGIPFEGCAAGLTVAQCEAMARDAANQVLADTYSLKTATLAGTTNEVSFVLGDVFHSDPVVLGGPSNVRFFAQNLNGYRDFASRHQNRRKMLVVGTNEGMLHAFDAGRASEVDGEVVFDDGTGKELFAYVPRPMLGELTERSTGTEHDWGVDGGVKVGDVFIDPVFENRTPLPDDREWRTVLLGSFRRGARGYFALDITQPDALREVDLGPPLNQTVVLPSDGTGVVPDCADKTTSEDPLTCHGELRFPAPLWEFDDTVWVFNDPDAPGDALGEGRFLPLDEELDANGNVVGNGFPDLSRSWSEADIGLIRICGGNEAACMPGADPAQSGDLEDRYVAVFGGGLPQLSDGADFGQSGNWVYMVDIETGEVIYKREVEGSVPAETAAVDTDQDGYLDRVYVVTTAGFVYRIDLAVLDNGNFPRLVPHDVCFLNDDGTRTCDRTQERIERTESPEAWAPRKIFDTEGRPIFFRPSVLFVPQLNRYALSFGTGDRDNLWREHFRPGTTEPIAEKFYTWVDDSADFGDADLPFDESFLRAVNLTDRNIDVNDDTIVSNFLLDREDGSRGWVLTLEAEEGERLLSAPFSLSGVTFFVTFLPDTDVQAGLCSRLGGSRIYAVNTTNANGFLRDALNERTRFIERPSFATAPFTEQAQTKNPSPDEPSTADSLELGVFLEEVQDELKTLFPANCKFGNYRIDVKTITSDQGLVFVAPVPVCLIEKNWKEF